MHRPQGRRASAPVVIALALASCTSVASPPTPGPGAASPSPSTAATTVAPSPATPSSVTVAFVEALDGEEPTDRVVPAFQGARLAFSIAELVGGLSLQVDVVAYDTGGDPAGTAAVAAEIGSTPDVVAAIAAPGLGEQEVLGDALEELGVPWLSLSGAGPALGERGWDGWRRLVADEEAQGQMLGRTIGTLPVARRGVCVLGDGTPAARSMLDAAVGAMRPPVVLRALVPDDAGDVAAVTRAVAGSGCGVVVWGGEGAQGAAIRRQLVEDGLRRVAFVGTDRIRDAGYLEAVGAAGEGTLATCPCVDVSTSTQLAAQRFIQDYQSDFGLPPGPYAVEGWDAARILVSAFRTGAVTRDDLRVALDELLVFDGLAGTYGFESNGDLALRRRSVHVSRVEGGRWLQLGPSVPAP